MLYKKLLCFSDGGCYGNSSRLEDRRMYGSYRIYLVPSVCSVRDVISYKHGANNGIEELYRVDRMELSEMLEYKSNNVAEAYILLESMKKCIEYLGSGLDVYECEVYSDSELTVKQVLGVYKVNNVYTMGYIKESRRILDMNGNRIKLRWLSSLEMKKVLGH